ncbi:uncharacterized protein LOC135073790 [Ostrinia nubilalis]|uniref:uncharacterized protein LOC114365198 n=1 Tax=Ostrinia furnacalis TaxID=93504 RepID=UPI001039B240|nr:uncharacterized protein LOC114365198 [Ostrinia furnacalis]
MNLLGYLITLVNLQSFDKSAGPVKDLSIKVAELQTLTNELRMIPGLDLDGFKATGYYRVGDVGKYLSRNLRDYIYSGEGNPKDEGVVLTLFFKDGPINLEDENLTYFLHKKIGNEEREQVRAILDG